MYRQLRVIAVIPAFDEERAIARTVATIPDFVDGIVVVDDASHDATSARAQVTPDVHVIRHAVNRGVGGAIVTGYRKALALGADVAVVMGGDGQMDPADLPALLEPIARGEADYVKGNRFRHPDVWREMPSARIAGNLALSAITRVTSGYRHVFDSQCGYTAIHRDALARLDLDAMWTRYGYPNDLLARLHAANVRVVDVPVRPIYGAQWKSGIKLSSALHPLPYVLARSWAQRIAAEARKPMPARMRIGVVTTSYPRFAGDPAGGFVAAHVAALRALGHDVDVIAAGEGPGRIPSDLFYRGGAPDALERGGHTLAAAAFTTRLAAEVARRASTWDLIVAHWLAPSALAALPNRVPLLAIAHGGDVHTLARMRLLGPMLHALRLRRAQLVFVSEELRAVARAHGPVDGAIVQPMGVDVGHFARLGRAPTDPPTVLVVARLVPIKGVDVAIAAMRQIDRPARLVIAGDGPERARLSGSNAELLGAVDTARRDELLRTASVVVVPSRVLDNGRTEGMPTIALEALAAGVPVVASAVGGLRSLSAAALVPPDDPGKLAASIDRVLAAPPADHALRASVAELDWPLVARRLLDVTPRTARRDA